MEHPHAFRFTEHHRLDSDERRRHQPPGPLVELVADTTPATVGDLGAGTGYFALPLLARLPAARLVAMDVEPRMLELLAARAADAGVTRRLECRRIERPPQLPADPGELDTVLLASLWHELPEPAATVAELGRVLAADGVVVVCDWSPTGSTEHGPPAAHRIEVEACERVLADGGWSRVTRHEIYPDHWTVTARRL